MPAPSPTHLRARASALQSHEDILRDQLQFFRENDAVECPPDADPDQLEQQYLDAVSRATDEDTQSSALLPVIEERAVSRRRRSRRSNVNAAQRSTNSPFPQSFQADLSRPSVFARREKGTLRSASAHVTYSSNSPSSNAQVHESTEAAASSRQLGSSSSTPSPTQDASSMLASMSLQQIREAQQEIYATLKPESISFLKQRSSQNVTAQTHVPSSSDPQPTESEHAIMPKRSQSSSSTLSPAQGASTVLPSMSSQQMHESKQQTYATSKPESVPFSIQHSSQRVITQESHSQSAPSGTESVQGGSQVLLTSREKEVEFDQNVTNTSEPEDEKVERAKRLWMTDAKEPLQTQECVDEVLRRAVEDMGPIAKERFDLDGNVLTAEQIEALPTHKGLHHHGTSPESAGYTLADLLILTRSTILSQRVMALKVLTALISSHGKRITEPMLQSDGIRLVFSPLPAAETFHSALTNQVAYLEAVECSLRQFCSLDQHVLVPDLYFASEFYSPALIREKESPLVSVLSEMHCIGTLVEIAEARFTSLNSVEYSKRALNAIRIIIFNSQSASQRLIEERESTNSFHPLSSLTQLAIGSDRFAPSTTMLSCDIIANIIVKAVWTSKDKLQDAFKHPLTDDFLMETALHLNWALRDSPIGLSSIEREAAKGVLRLFRAFLSQNCGVQCISAFLQAICRLVQETDDNLGVEGYLLLEAYVHCLAATMMQAPDKQSETGGPERGSSSKLRAKETSLAQFAKDQLSGLTPQVVTAAKIVVATGNRHSTPRRAAAGHFVATSLAVISVPFDETYYNQLKCVASEVNFRIAKSDLDAKGILRESQALASLSHATARILSGNLVEKGFAGGEVERLVDVAIRERTVMSKRPDREGRWKLIGNAASEWVGLLSRLECTLSVAQTASVLLPCLSDVQVILDLVSRCILKKDMLLIMGRDTDASEAEDIARKFIPLTWKSLNDDSELRTKVLRKFRDPVKAPVLVSLDSLVQLWLEHDGLTSEGLKLCRLLFLSDLLSNSMLFETLIEVPLSRCSDPLALFDFVLEIGKTCIETEGRLVRAETNTKKSTLSTSTDSRFYDAAVSLTDHLVARGPAPATSSRETVDPLGSIVLSIMCGMEADSTLRQNMWSRCVEECGGAALFENALFLYSPEGNSTSTETCLEKEDMICRYFSAISNSYLDPSRCPENMRRIVLSRLSGYMSSQESTTSLENLLQSLSPISRRTALGKVYQFLATNGGNNYEPLMKWVRIML